MYTKFIISYVIIIIIILFCFNCLTIILFRCNHVFVVSMKNNTNVSNVNIHYRIRSHQFEATLPAQNFIIAASVNQHYFSNEVYCIHHNRFDSSSSSAIPTPVLANSTGLLVLHINFHEFCLPWKSVYRLSLIHI